jgi:hypothetical protein
VKPDDQLPSLSHIGVPTGLALHVSWSNGVEATLDFSRLMEADPFRSLADPEVSEQVQIGEWGHSLVWPGDVELSADSLWLMTLEALGRDDTLAFLSWRMRHGLGSQKAAAALGISERDVARYSSAQAQVPSTVLLACRGWEALQAA